jgi:hypothetical protein
MPHIHTQLVLLCICTLMYTHLMWLHVILCTVGGACAGGGGGVCISGGCPPNTGPMLSAYHMAQQLLP